MRKKNYCSHMFHIRDDGRLECVACGEVINNYATCEEGGINDATPPTAVQNDSDLTHDCHNGMRAGTTTCICGMPRCNGFNCGNYVDADYPTIQLDGNFSEIKLEEQSEDPDDYEPFERGNLKDYRDFLTANMPDKGDRKDVKNDHVLQPSHYARFILEPITFCMVNDLPGHIFSIIKYACRAGHKLYPGMDAIESEIKDLEKVRRFAQMRIRLLKGEGIL